MDVPWIYDAWGHLGYVFILWGTLSLARKQRRGWILRGIGEAVWVVLGFVMGFTSMWFWGIVFLGLEVYGWYNWRE